MQGSRIVDAWVNVSVPSRPAAWQKEVARTVFGRPPEEIFRSYSQQEILAVMDAKAVDHAVLTLALERPEKQVLSFVEKHPERFSLSTLVDPRQGMRALRQLQALARQLPLKLVRVIPCLLNTPPDDRVYYPLYACCIELGLPISVNTGLPGPPLPGRCQDPMALEDVCLFFPELVLVMAHGADPWWEVALRLMQRHENLFMMTSAWSPRALPSALLQFMNGRGQNKVMFASDFPFLDWERCLTEAAALDLQPEARTAYLSGTARRLLGLGAPRP